MPDLSLDAYRGLPAHLLSARLQEERARMPPPSAARTDRSSPRLWAFLRFAWTEARRKRPVRRGA